MMVMMMETTSTSWKKEKFSPLYVYLYTCILDDDGDDDDGVDDGGVALKEKKQRFSPLETCADCRIFPAPNVFHCKDDN